MRLVNLRFRLPVKTILARECGDNGEGVGTALMMFANKIIANKIIL